MNNPQRTTIVSIACNHYHNGMFQGHFSSIECGEVTLESPWADRNLKIRVDEQAKQLTIGKRSWPFISSKDWLGNWCWNGYRVTSEVAAEIMTYVRSKRYRPEVAPTHLWDTKVFVPSDFQGEATP